MRIVVSLLCSTLLARHADGFDVPNGGQLRFYTGAATTLKRESWKNSKSKTGLRMQQDGDIDNGPPTNERKEEDHDDHVRQKFQGKIAKVNDTYKRMAAELDVTYERMAAELNANFFDIVGTIKDERVRLELLTDFIEFQSRDHSRDRCVPSCYSSIKLEPNDDAGGSEGTTTAPVYSINYWYDPYDDNYCSPFDCLPDEAFHLFSFEKKKCDHWIKRKYVVRYKGS